MPKQVNLSRGNGVFMRTSFFRQLQFGFFLLLFGSSASLLTPSITKANDIYLAHAAVGGANGAECSSALPISWFNNAANWGTASHQIGPGTTVHICGTITGTPGATALTVHGNGAADHPVTILFEPGSVMTAPYWGGASGWCGVVDMCTGAITVNGFNYITIDGGKSGIIQNTANGTGLAYGHSSVGVFIKGSNLIVKDLIIRNIYTNRGATSGATDINGHATADIHVDRGSTNIQINGNTLNDARAGIWADTFGSNTNFFDNTIADHAWQISLSGSGTINVHDNDISDWTNWQYPPSTYHTDGIIVYGDTSVLDAMIYNNYIHGDLGSAGPTGFIFCTYGVKGSGSGSACTIYNNLLVGTGYSATHDQGLYFHSGNGTNPLGPHKIYNNTFVGFLYQIYAESDATIDYTVKNNIFLGNGLQWYVEGNDSPLGNLTCDHNIYWGGRQYGAFSWGTVSNGHFANWQGAGHDLHGSNSNPNLGSTYHLTATSGAALTIGANLSSLNMPTLNVGKASIVGINDSNDGAPRSETSANWPAGAYGKGGNGSSAASASSTPPESTSSASTAPASTPPQTAARPASSSTIFWFAF